MQIISHVVGTADESAGASRESPTLDTPPTNMVNIIYILSDFTLYFRMTVDLGALPTDTPSSEASLSDSLKFSDNS
jgi:hypothetical protein